MRIFTFFFTVLNAPPLHRIKVGGVEYFNIVGEDRENRVILRVVVVWCLAINYTTRET
jgi:hypothetical protein